MEFLKKNRKVVIISMILMFCIGVVCVVFCSKHEGENVNLSVIGESTTGESTTGETATNENIGDNVSNEKSSENEGTSVKENIDKVNSNNIDNGDLERSGEKSDNENSKNNLEMMFIHIVGEVRNEGIVVLKKGDRIKDAIEKAGGATELADLSKINLAFVLSDGQKVRIPSKNDNDKNQVFVTYGSGDNEKGLGEQISDGGENMNINMGDFPNNSRKINVNTASQTELETLDGIGPSLAMKIIKYREKNGKFKKIEDIKNVSGIGNSKFEEIKEKLEV